MKKFKIYFTILTFVSVTACGFTPVLKEADFSKIKIRNISYDGASGLTYFLKNNMNLNFNKAFIEGYNVKISISETINSATKDTAGITIEEEIIINIKVNIFNKNNKKIGQDTISDRRVVSITNNISTDSEAKRIEKENIIRDLIQKLNFTIKAKILSNQK